MSYFVGIAVILVAITYFYFDLAFRLNENNYVVIKVFLFIVGIWFIPGLVSVCLHMGDAAGAPAKLTGAVEAIYRATVWVSILITGIILLFYAWKLLEYFNGLIAEKKNGKIKSHKG